MRIYYFTPFYLPQSNAAAVRGYWMIQTLREAGHDVEVMTTIDTPKSSKLKICPADNKQSFAKRMIFEVLSGIELFCRIMISPYELFIFSTPPFITVSIAHIACRIRRLPYILDVRDIYPDIYFAQDLIPENSRLGKWAKAFTRSMYHHSRAVITVTPGLVEKVKRMGPETKRVELIINGFDRDHFKPSDIKYERPTVVFHGNMGKVQNIPIILQVANLLPHVDFLFIGEGPEAEHLKSTDLKNVTYLGPKSYQDIPAIISKAHIGFSARRDDDIGADAFPVKAFEYLGVGIPVILTPKSGVMTKLVSEGLFEYSNSEAKEISQKILDLLTSKYSVKASASFSRQDISKKILGLID